MSEEVKKTEGDYIELNVDDFKKLLLCARTSKHDYFIMRNILEMNPIKETATECIHRMKFRKPIFNILDKFKDFEI